MTDKLTRVARLIRFLLPAIVGALVAGVSTPARADLFSYSESSSISPTTTDFSKALTIPTFNKNLGTLYEVEVSYKNSEVFQGTLVNNSARAQNFTVTETSNFMLQMGTTTLLTNTLGATQSYSNMPSRGSATFGKWTENGFAGAAIYKSGSVFNDFESSSADVNLDFSTLTSTMVVGGGGNITTGIYTQAAAMVTVEYFYQPYSSAVPEPSSLAMSLMGGFVAGSVWFTRRRGRRKSFLAASSGAGFAIRRHS